ncbi:heterokaryon incompatibility protein [Fusarium heterosporum]|uniref:Heterokaryon incompatibility protein n=1 Tax=Fusarium heterosporum TaxID=42747 RepID=A0A8H5SNZ7_FUSHE|nr:heterokaryon incompatibility protein [Fusarium heterosporum]
MDTFVIPPNNPRTPRWLLDLKKWEIQPFDQIPRDILESEGYGIVSYTWGYIANFDELATGLPRNVPWDLPTTTKWPLSKAREVMEKIGTRYVWWDWMCVPQGGKGRLRSLTEELKAVQGEEIGKQLHIYSQARKSIVWLHSTNWDESSALKSIICLPRPDNIPQERDEIWKYITQAESLLKTARNDEWWLQSGWTLQEGALLNSTRLIDGNGTTFSSPDLRHSIHDDKVARVDDIGDPVTYLAHHLAGTYFIQLEGHDPDRSRPVLEKFASSLPKDPETALKLRRLVKSFTRSGLVGYSQFSPLYILAGKQGRNFGRKEDSCWALVGALQLEGMPVKYDIDMDVIKGILLKALVKKYQCMMLNLPFPELQFEDEAEKGATRGFKWIDISEGALLPVSLFLVKESVDPQVDETTLPILEFSTALTLKSREKTFSILHGYLKDLEWFCHYRQDEDGLRIVNPVTIEDTERSHMQELWLVPISRVEPRDDVTGRRCLLILDYKPASPAGNLALGTFGGQIDVWGTAFSNVDVEEMTLNPS